MNGGSSVGNGGHHLAEGLGPHIADGVDAGNAGLCGLTGSDIARLIPVSYTHLDVYKRQKQAS